MIGYQAQVIPAMMAGFTLVYLERFFRKITPQSISMIFVPFFALIPSVIIAHCVLGPIGWKIGNAISYVINLGLTGDFSSIFGAVFGFLYAPFVITGLHHMTTAIDLQLIADYGGTTLWPMIALSNIAQGSAVLGMLCLNKKDAKLKEVGVPACISCYLGVTEPAIFGVNLKHNYPFLCAMIGSGIAGAISVSCNIMANGIGVGGLPGILSIKPQYMGVYALCILVTIVVPFTLTYLVGKKKNIEEIEIATNIENNNSMISNKFVAFLTGDIMAIENVDDAVFSNKILGDGVAIEPESNVLTSPVNGVITALIEDSFHACGIALDNGMEVLLHIGLDTVKMNGDGFIPHIKIGDRVVVGQDLITFDIDKIQNAGFKATTIMVVTEALDTNLKFENNQKVISGKDLIGEY